jgi:hypothetical protein
MEEFGLVRMGMLADGFILVVRNDGFVPDENVMPKPVMSED